MANCTRKIFAVLLAVFLTLTFMVACGENATDNSSTDSTNSSSSEPSTSTDGDISDSSVDNTASEEESTIPQDTVVSFLACPDNIIHPSVFYDALERAARNNNTKVDTSDPHNAVYEFDSIYEHVAAQIKDADVSYINQETLIGGTSGKIIGYPCFNSPKPAADTVIDLGFDVVNLAHNHMLDSGNTRYLENCYNVFDSAGLDVIGYYPNKASTENITVIESKGIRIAFLAYTYDTNGIRIKNSDFVIPYFSDELIKKQVACAKQVADFIIVSCHWGYEDTFSINSDQKHYANLMCNLGVDVVLGMHPHVIQPMQWMTSESGHKTLVVYSLGNFVSGMVAGKNMLAGMLSLDIVKDAETGEISIESPLFVPTVTHYVKKNSIASNDTGYRDFKICYLSDYTEEQAKAHGVCVYELGKGPTLVNGKFSKQTLLDTLYKYIPMEFLPEEYQK